MTNPIGKNTKTVGVNMPKKLAADVEKRAESMGISTSLYIKTVLRQHIASKKKLVLKG